MDVDADHSEGERLTGFLTAAPVLARGALGDGRRWTLRAPPVGEGPVLPRVALALDEGVGHSLASLALTEDAPHLAACWLSRPSGVARPGAAVLAAPGVREVRRIDDAGEAVAELVYRERGPGWAVFVLETRTRGGLVVGVDGAGAEVARVVMEHDVDPEPPARATADVPPRVGAVFVAGTALLGGAGLLIALVAGSGVVSRLAVGLLGLLALLTEPARKAWAARRYPSPRARRPAHALPALWIAITVGWAGVMWATNPVPGLALLLIEAAAIGAVTVFLMRRADR